MVRRRWGRKGGWIYLDIVFIAPLRAVVALFPSVVHIHKGQVVPHIALVEELVCIVSIDSLVLRPVKDGCAHRHHGTNGSNLHGALQQIFSQDKAQVRWST